MLNLLRNKLNNFKRIKTFGTYELALKDSFAGGYTNSELAKVVFTKNYNFREILRSTKVIGESEIETFVISAILRSNKINVIDYGGGGGYHYSLTRLILGEGSSIRWAVIENSAYVLESKNFSEINCNFYTSISQALEYVTRPDVVLAFNSIQYSADPLVALSDLVKINAPVIILTEVPLVLGSMPIITVQNSKLSENGPGPLPANFKDIIVKYPRTYTPKASFEEMLFDKYELRFKIHKKELLINDEVVQVLSYVCDLKQ